MVVGGAIALGSRRGAARRAALQQSGQNVSDAHRGANGGCYVGSRIVYAHHGALNGGASNVRKRNATSRRRRRLALLRGSAAAETRRGVAPARVRGRSSVSLHCAA